MRVAPSPNYPPDVKTQPAFVFETGILHVKQQGYGDEDGDGSLTFREDALVWEQSDDSSKMYASVRVCRDDLLFLRDKLCELFPPDLIKVEGIK